jgi:hypothetical protein
VALLEFDTFDKLNASMGKNLLAKYNLLQSVPAAETVIDEAVTKSPLT